MAYANEKAIVKSQVGRHDMHGQSELWHSLEVWLAEVGRYCYKIPRWKLRQIVSRQLEVVSWHWT